MSTSVLAEKFQTWDGTRDLEDWLSRLSIKAEECPLGRRGWWLLAFCWALLILSLLCIQLQACLHWACSGVGEHQPELGTFVHLLSICLLAVALAG